MSVIRQLGASLGLRYRHHQAATAKAQIQKLHHVLILLQQHILADDTDICRTVFNIRRHINSLGNNEAHLGFLVADNQLARILGNVFGAVAYLRQQAYRLIEKLALRQCYSNVFVHKNTPLYFPAISLMSIIFFFKLILHILTIYSHIPLRQALLPAGPQPRSAASRCGLRGAMLSLWQLPPAACLRSRLPARPRCDYW